MSLVRTIALLILLSGCEQTYSRDTLILAGPEFCGARWEVLETLFMVKKETLMKGSQIKLDRVRLELTGSEGERTVSILMSWPEGFSCVIAHGGYLIRETRSARKLQ